MKSTRRMMPGLTRRRMLRGMMIGAAALGLALIPHARRPVPNMNRPMLTRQSWADRPAHEFIAHLQRKKNRIPNLPELATSATEKGFIFNNEMITRLRKKFSHEMINRLNVRTKNQFAHPRERLIGFAYLMEDTYRRIIVRARKENWEFYRETTRLGKGRKGFEQLSRTHQNAIIVYGLLHGVENVIVNEKRQVVVGHMIENLPYSRPGTANPVIRIIHRVAEIENGDPKELGTLIENY